MYEEKRIYESELKQAESKRMPQVSEAFVGLDKAVEEHLKIAAEIEQRLSPVLRSEPEATGNNPKDAPTVVPFAQRVNEAVQRLHRLADQYHSILRRLEI